MSLVYCACGYVEDNDQHACPVTQKRLRQQLSLAEEGLANYAQELANARHDIERLTAACSAEATEVEQLKTKLLQLADKWEGSTAVAYNDYSYGRRCAFEEAARELLAVVGPAEHPSTGPAEKA